LNRIVPIAIIAAISGGLVAAFVIYELTDDGSADNELVLPTVEGYWS
jgi:hypothetical protein